MTGTIRPDYQAIPAPLLRALKHNSYDKGDSDFTVTELLSPPQKAAFVADPNVQPLQPSPYAGFMSVLGTAVHAMLESHVKASNGEVAEERMYARFLGHLVGGQFDLYEADIKRITDYKVTAYLKETVKSEHYKQGQMNALLAKLNGLEVKDICVVYIQRDWSAAQARRQPNYPDTPITPFVFSFNELYARELILSHLKDHIAARKGNVRDCTREEQWAEADKWACKKPQSSRARKLYDTEEEALRECKPGEQVEHRPAVRTYCEDYCNFKHICPQYARENGLLLLPPKPSEIIGPDPHEEDVEFLEHEGIDENHYGQG